MVEPETLPVVAVIVVEPTARHVASPVLLIVAIPLFDELHVTDAVKSRVLPSEKVPVAVNCLVVPIPLVGLIGVTAIDESALTVRVVEPVTPSVAVMLVEPAATADARPFEPDALLTVATAVFEEVHVANGVKSWDAPPDKVPVAMNCWVVPTAIVGSTGVTAIDVTASRVRAAEPEMAPNVAMIAAEPTAVAVARPELSMVATPVLLQVTNGVKSWDAPFDKVPVALNCWVVPTAMVGLAGVTAIELSAATVSVVDPEMLPEVAVIVVEPVVMAAASPVLLMFAMSGIDELHVTDEVMS